MTSQASVLISILFFGLFGSPTGFSSQWEDKPVQSLQLTVNASSRTGILYEGPYMVQCSAFGYQPVSTDVKLQITLGTRILYGTAVNVTSDSGDAGSMLELPVNLTTWDTYLSCTCTKLNPLNLNKGFYLAVLPIRLSVYVGTKMIEDEAVYHTRDSHQNLFCYASGLACKPNVKDYQLRVTIGGQDTAGDLSQTHLGNGTNSSSLAFCRVSWLQTVHFTTSQSGQDVQCQVKQDNVYTSTFKLLVEERIENMENFGMFVDGIAPDPPGSELKLFEGEHDIECSAQDFYPPTADVGLRVMVGPRNLTLPATVLEATGAFKSKARVVVTTYIRKSDKNVTCTCDNLNPVKKAVSYRLAVKPVYMELYVGGHKEQNGSLVQTEEGETSVRCDVIGLSVKSPDPQLELTVGQHVVIPASANATSSVIGREPNRPHFKWTTLNGRLNVTRTHTSKRLQCRLELNHHFRVFVVLDVWFNTYQTHAVCPERWELGQPVTLTCQIRVQRSNDPERGRRCDPEGNPAPTPTLLRMQGSLAPPSTTSSPSTPSPLTSTLMTSSPSTPSPLTSTLVTPSPSTPLPLMSTPLPSTHVTSPPYTISSQSVTPASPLSSLPTLSDVITRCVATVINVTNMTSSVSDDDSSDCVTRVEAADDGEGVTYRANFSFVVSGNDSGWWRCGVGWPCHQGQNYSADVILDSPTYQADNCDSLTVPVEVEEEEEVFTLTTVQTVAIAAGVGVPAAAGACYAVATWANRITDCCQYFFCIGGGKDDDDDKKSNATSEDGDDVKSMGSLDDEVRDGKRRRSSTLPEDGDDVKSMGSLDDEARDGKRRRSATLPEDESGKDRRMSMGFPAEDTLSEEEDDLGIRPEEVLMVQKGTYEGIPEDVLKVEEGSHEGFPEEEENTDLQHAIVTDGYHLYA